MSDETRAEFDRWWRADGTHRRQRTHRMVAEYAWQAAIAHERTRCAAIARAHGAEDVAAEIEHSN